VRERGRKKNKKKRKVNAEVVLLDDEMDEDD
jgi:hypothetical protein